MSQASSEKILDLRNRAAGLLGLLRGDVSEDTPPRSLDLRFTIKQASEMVGRATNTIRKAEEAGEIPAPERRESGHRYGYTLAEINVMREHFGTRPGRQVDEEPVVLAVQNFKGGVGKSTLSVHLAQFLAMMGYRVLFIDVDPQASATSMFGYRPELFDADFDTLLPIFSDEEYRLDRIIKPTHWDGLDIIPSCLDLYGAEYALAMPMDAGGGGARDRLEKLRAEIPTLAAGYDVIVCDPPPALGMISLSVIRAVNALIIPTPPSSLDYSSTVSYLDMLAEALQTLERLGFESQFKFVQLLATKMSEMKSAHIGLRDAMQEVFGGDLLQTALLDSAEFDNALIDGRTVYEFTGRSNATYKRCRSNLDLVLADIELAIRKTWPSHQRELRAAGRF